MADTYEITQRLGALATIYDVRAPNDEEPSITIKGSFATATPTFDLIENKDGKTTASLKGNVVKTKFRITSDKGSELATLNFAAVSLTKSLTMTVGSKGYHAKAGLLGGTFECADNDGNVGLSIVKEEGLRDKFRVDIKGDISRDVALLAAVAIHSRFYE
jgi:uncharacterized protein YxjI